MLTPKSEYTAPDLKFSDIALEDGVCGVPISAGDSTEQFTDPIDYEW